MTNAEQQQALTRTLPAGGAADPFRLAQVFHKSGLFRDIRDEAQAIVKIVYGIRCYNILTPQRILTTCRTLETSAAGTKKGCEVETRSSGLPVRDVGSNAGRAYISRRRVAGLAVGGAGRSRDGWMRSASGASGSSSVSGHARRTTLGRAGALLALVATSTFSLSKTTHSWLWQARAAATCWNTASSWHARSAVR